MRHNFEFVHWYMKEPGTAAHRLTLMLKHHALSMMENLAF